jgi:hypothetical protein
MKKSIIFFIIALFAISVTAQPLKKGNLIGVHVATVELKPGVTMDQFKTFLSEKLFPAYNKTDSRWQIFLADGIRGEHENQIGIIHVIKSEKERDSYYNPDGTASNKQLEKSKKVKPLLDELEKLGTFKTTYTDWLIN